MAEFVDEELNDIFCDSTLEPLGAEPEFVENQISTWSVGGRAEMVRCRTILHPGSLM